MLSEVPNHLNGSGAFDGQTIEDPTAVAIRMAGIMPSVVAIAKGRVPMGVSAYPAETRKCGAPTKRKRRTESSPLAPYPSSCFDMNSATLSGARSRPKRRTEEKITMLPRSEPRITGAAPHHEFNSAPEDAARGITKPGTHMEMRTAVKTNTSKPTIKSFSNVAARFTMMSSTRCQLLSFRPVPPVRWSVDDPAAR